MTAEGGGPLPAGVLRLHGTLGTADEPDLARRLHALAHAGGAIEVVRVPEADRGRRRLRLVSDRGTDCAISLDRGEELADGAVLLLEADRAVLARVGAEVRLRLRPADAAAALALGWHAGHLHWRVRFEGADLLVLPDGPPAGALARVADLIAAGRVAVVEGG